MREIKKAKQESNAHYSERNEYRCRVCDGPVERPRLVCRECWYRDQKEQEWESYLELLDVDESGS